VGGESNYGRGGKRRWKGVQGFWNLEKGKKLIKATEEGDYQFYQKRNAKKMRDTRGKLKKKKSQRGGRPSSLSRAKARCFLRANLKKVLF